MRDRWSSKTLFLFAAIGSAVGLGNVWRFPYMTYEYGGGAFLIPYLIALLVLGIPLLIMEFAIGQKLQKGAIDAFKSVNHRLRGIGFGAIFSGFVVVVYYAAVMAWALIYLLQSFDLNLPWAGNSESHFFNNVLQISSGIDVIGGINLPVFFALAATWIIIYFCVFKGVKSAEKVIAVTMPLPIILLVILFLRGITLEGAGIGILAYLTPDFSALLDPKIWVAAVSQIFFTLSLGFGIMIAYASYNKETEDVAKNAFITAIANSLISIFAGFVVFAVLGHMAVSQGVGIADVAASGPGLAFVVFPQALSLLPLPGLFSVLFFATLLMLGIDSAFSLVESVNTVIADRSAKTAKHVIAALVCLLAFLLGILFTTKAGLYFLDVIDYFITNFGLVLVGLCQALAIGWVFGAEKLRSYINEVSSIKIGKWWTLMIKYIIPVLLFGLLVNQFITEMANPYGGYPTWALAIGWACVIVPLLIGIILSLFPSKAEVEL